MSIFIPKSFKAFVEKFSATFGDLNKKFTSTTSCDHFIKYLTHQLCMHPNSNN